MNGKSIPWRVNPPALTIGLWPTTSADCMNWAVRFVARWAVTSTFCPRPLRWASHRAMSAPPAASAAAWVQAGTAAARSGGRPASPVRAMAPEAACTIRSVAA